MVAPKFQPIRVLYNERSINLGSKFVYRISSRSTCLLNPNQANWMFDVDFNCGVWTSVSLANDHTFWILLFLFHPLRQAILSFIIKMKTVTDIETFLKFKSIIWATHANSLFIQRFENNFCMGRSLVLCRNNKRTKIVNHFGEEKQI